MNWKHQARAFVLMAIVVASIGCMAVDKTPDVVTTPGSTTVVHDRTSPPNVVVTPPASHTETHTDTQTTIPPPGQGTAATSTTTTTGN